MTDFPCLTLAHPSVDCRAFGYQRRTLQQLDITLHNAFQVWKWLEVSSKGTQSVLSFFSKILLDNSLCSSIVKCPHAAAGVLHEHNLIGTQELLGDYNRSEGVFGIAASIANDVGVAKVNAICSSGVNSSIHAAYEQRVSAGAWRGD